MSDDEIKTKLTKSDRKNAKKLHKKILNVLKEYGDAIKISEQPTLHIFIGNGGLLCGWSREHLLSLFAKFGHVSELVMLPRKAYSLLSYRSIIDARTAFDALNGLVTNTNGIVPPAPLYLKYLHSQVPYLCPSQDIYPVEGIAKHIDGLVVKEEFLNEEYEKKLVDFFESKLTAAASEQSLKNRKVLHFGYEFLYGSNNIDKSKPLQEKIPSICTLLLDKMLREKLISSLPDQLTVNQYQPGQGIPSHIDTHSAFEDGIVSVSLNSQVCMDFEHPDGLIIPRILPQRSLLVMSGESRYLWTHGITPCKHDIVYAEDDTSAAQDNVHLTLKERGMRISLTFRKILHKPCKCSFADKCDSQQSRQRELTRTNLVVPNTSSEASNLENEHVYKVYEEIATHFSGTRHSPWPKVKDFLCNLPNGSLVADVGCGNGKYLGVNEKILAFGSDRSFSLAKICDERNFEVLVADCLKTPYRTNCFDACICIAVIHHLSTEKRRLEALKELVRITRVNGLVLVYVWAIEQKIEDIDEKMLKTTLNVVQNENNVENEIPPEDVHEENSEANKNQDGVKSSESISDASDTIEVSEGRYTFQQQDLLVPWHLKRGNKKEISNDNEKKEKVLHRFYHVFKQGELERLCLQMENIEIQQIYFDSGNWCVILKKMR